MIPNKQWQQDMMDGVHADCAAQIMANKCGGGGAGLLLGSVKKPIDHGRMDRDTSRRTGGRCPIARGYLQRGFTRLEESLRYSFRSDQSE